MNEENAAQQNYPRVNTEMTFVWICPECKKQNRRTWDAYVFYKSLSECIDCEKAVYLLTPWERK